MKRFYKTSLRLVPLLLIMAFIASIIGPDTVSANPGWYNTSWLYRKKITINAANVTATLTNFPIMIQLANHSDLGIHAQLDGDDILFTANDEVTKIPHEIEKYSSNGTTANITAWVKVPVVTSVIDTDIYMYYGNAGVGSQQDAVNVWDNNFKMVQHLEETAGGANAITDSTMYGNNGTDFNAPTFSVNGTADGAITLAKASSEYIQLPASNTILDSGNFTLEAWFRTSTNHPAYGVGTMEGRIINLHRGATASSAVSLYVEQDMIGLLYYNGTTHIWLKYTVNYYNNVNHHVAVSHNTTTDTYRLYFDGVEVASENNTFGSIGTFPAFIGAHDATAGLRYFDGTIDEVRISNTQRSADWIKTSYNNLNSPYSFLIPGTEQYVFSAPTVTTNDATLVQETTATLNGFLSSDGGEACQYSFEWGTTPGVYTANISWNGSINTGASFSLNLIGLTKGQSYYYRAKVKNSADFNWGGEKHFLTKPDGPTSLTATANSSSRIDLSWTKGTGAQRTMIRRSTGTYPATYLDGDQVYFDTGTSFSDTGLPAGTTHYYRAWSEVTGSQQWSNTFVSSSNTTFAAPPPSVIGGKVYSVNKAAILLPWILVGIVSTFIFVRVILYIRKKTQSRPPPEKNLQH